MANRQPANLPSPGEESAGLHFSEIALRSEVAFWREMISARSDALPREAGERMRQALALAEWRLAEHYERRPGGDVSQLIDFAQAKKRLC